MNTTLKFLIQTIPRHYSVAVREQEEGYSLVFHASKAFLFVPAAEFEETRRYYEAQGMVDELAQSALHAQVA